MAESNDIRELCGPDLTCQCLACRYREMKLFGKTFCCRHKVFKHTKSNVCMDVIVSAVDSIVVQHLQVFHHSRSRSDVALQVALPGIFVSDVK